VNRTLLVLALAAAIGGCAFVPQANHRLEEVRIAYAEVMGDAHIHAMAPRETRLATEAYDDAVRAWNTLQDPAEVDHLAYVARQRLAIARETALRAAAAAMDPLRRSPAGARASNPSS
jgi:hypothetical protein